MLNEMSGWTLDSDLGKQEWPLTLGTLGSCPAIFTPRSTAGRLLIVCVMERAQKVWRVYYAPRRKPRAEVPRVQGSPLSGLGS